MMAEFREMLPLALGIVTLACGWHLFSRLVSWSELPLEKSVPYPAMALLGAGFGILFGLFTRGDEQFGAPLDWLGFMAFAFSFNFTFLLAAVRMQYRRRLKRAGQHSS